MTSRGKPLPWGGGGYVTHHVGMPDPGFLRRTLFSSSLGGRFPSVLLDDRALEPDAGGGGDCSCRSTPPPRLGSFGFAGIHVQAARLESDLEDFRDFQLREGGGGERGLAEAVKKKKPDCCTAWHLLRHTRGHLSRLFVSTCRQYFRFY